MNKIKLSLKGYNKMALFAGASLCTISLLLLVPLSRELQYSDNPDVRALLTMILVSILFGVLSIGLSKKTAA